MLSQSGSFPDRGKSAPGLGRRLQAGRRYLARYVGRTAISDERIVHADDHAVTFCYTDSATQERKECQLKADVFMRPYLQHVLPPGQHRVRYFGWMQPAARARRMKVETLLAVIVVHQKADTPDWHRCCPHCHAFTLVRIGRLARAPPACTRHANRRPWTVSDGRDHVVAIALVLSERRIRH